MQFVFFGDSGDYPGVTLLGDPEFQDQRMKMSERDNAADVVLTAQLSAECAIELVDELGYLRQFKAMVQETGLPGHCAPYVAVRRAFDVQLASGRIVHARVLPEHTSHRQVSRA